MKLPKKSLIVASLLLTLLASGIIFVYASDDGNIHACVNSKGRPRIVGAVEDCKPEEDVLTWNIMGLEGPPGDPGDPGPQGEQGPPGDDGNAALANQGCGPNLFVVGFDQQGDVLCEASLTFPPDTVFVSTNDPGANDDPSCGNILTGYACKTITFGLNRADNTSATTVAVGVGVYPENVVLIAGIDLLGGYDTFFVHQDLMTLRAVIRGATDSTATVFADSITSPTVFEGFIVEGPTVTTPSGNSIGILVRDSDSSLAIRHNLVRAGRAGDGVAGDDGNGGVSGNNGEAGEPAFAFNPSTTPDNNAGGAGGASAFGAAGGDGGEATIPIYDQQQGSGVGGSGVSGGSGGSGGYDGQFAEVSQLILPNAGSHNASDGSDGLSGQNGSGGAGGSGSGLLLSGTWTTPGGDVGDDGHNGSGGGGGGAAGGAQEDITSPFNPSDPVMGATGGGGGSGGEGGIGGEGGGGGGSAFGIFIYFSGTPLSWPVITMNDIYLGVAGDGGDGGSGGVGGAGGLGAAGGSSVIFGSGQAGDGGDGGAGGHGGGGGGGKGGDSVGVFANQVVADPNYATSNTIYLSTGVAGMPGSGGLSFGDNGGNGQSGLASAKIYVLVPPP